MKKALLILGLLAIIFCGFSQKPASEILLDIKKFKQNGSVLYIAAHPDDENTRLISYLSNGALIRTGYLSLTRGDGGQNLIGTEKGEYLGLLRTQELLEARKVDGGEQFFTRAVDFGYSKSSDETLEKWNKKEVLKDMVWVIRNFKPDVMITRFPPINYAGHGHHSSSAILAEEAFEKAADPNYAPEQLQYVKVWQAKSLYFNTSTWWDKTIPEQAENNPDFLQIDIGTFNPEIGKWHNEIASLSRSKHRSQGFGTTSARGSQTEYLKYVKGEKLNQLFSESELSWAKYNQGQKVEDRLNAIISNFDIQNPSLTVDDLFELKGLVAEMNFENKSYKLKQLDKIIANTLGLYGEALAQEEITYYLNSNKIEVHLLNPSSKTISVEKVKINGEARDFEESNTISQNEFWETTFDVVTTSMETSQPYWLVNRFENMFEVNSQQLIGLAENMPDYKVNVDLKYKDYTFSLEIPVEYKWRDGAIGELRVNLKNYPRVMVTPFVGSLIFTEKEYQKIPVTVKCLKENSEVSVTANLPKGWSAKNANFNLNFEKAGDEKVVVFEVMPNVNSGGGVVSFSAKESLKNFTRGLQTITYPHITKQVLFPFAEVKVTKLNLEHNLKKIGYLMGAGDEVADLLQNNISVEVVQLLPEDLNTTDLSQFDAIVAGIRLYNTKPEINFAKDALTKYMENGGTYVVQYNTSRGESVEDIGPYPMKLSRDRVTVEEAKAELLEPKHPIFSYPNAITSEDFDNWVQERGLYFSNEWAGEYTPLIAWNDPGEEPTKGGLLVADVGQGAFIYTGISFFRQLPKGVPGAYRLLVNILSYKPEQNK